MNGYEKRTEQKKAAIIRAAQELFADKGITEVSITDIASRAGVSRVTLFKYFGSKDSLAEEAMRTWVEYLIDEYQRIVTSDLPYSKKLLLLFSTRIMGRQQIGEQFIRSAAWEDTEMKRIVSEMSQKCTRPMIMNFLQEGRDTGYIDSSIDDDAIMAFLSAMGPVIQNPIYIKKGPEFHTGIFNLFMGGLIKGWYELNKQEKE